MDIELQQQSGKRKEIIKAQQLNIKGIVQELFPLQPLQNLGVLIDLIFLILL